MSTSELQLARAAGAIGLLVVCAALAACGGSSAGAKARGASVGAASTEPLGTRASGQAANARPSTSRTERRTPSTVRQALTKFAACLRQRGVDIPVLQSSHSGAALNIEGIDTGSTRFKTAWVKCRRAVDVGRAFHKLETSVRSAA